MLWKLALASASLLVAIGSAEIIDSEPKSIELIANALCKDSEKFIGRQSTIVLLTDYFSSDVPETLVSCREQYLGPLKRLRDVLVTSGDNVCSRLKIQAINRFHWDYIVASLSRKWRKVSDETIPEPLRLFFMHYANEITNQCQKTLVDRLKVPAGDKSFEADSLIANKLGGSIDQLGVALVPQSRVKNFDNFFLLWDQIFAKERKKGYVYKEYIDELTGEAVILHMKMRDPNNAWAMQQQCRMELRPIYQDTVLPVMMLLEMGYGRVDEHSGQIVRGNKLIGNWYALAQLCELVIPINFYLDQSMKPGEAAMLSNLEDTKDLIRASSIVKLDQIHSAFNIKTIQFDDLLISVSNVHITTEVKSNLKSRNKFFRQIFRNVLSNVKGKLKSKLKNFFLFRKNDKSKYVKENGDELLENSKAEINELLEEEEEGSANPRSLTRNKRKAKKELTQAQFDRRMAIIFNTSLIVAFLIVCTIIVLTVTLTHGG